MSRETFEVYRVKLEIEVRAESFGNAVQAAGEAIADDPNRYARVVERAHVQLARRPPEELVPQPTETIL